MWYKLPDELLHMKLPFSAIILASLLYDADRAETGKVTVKQTDMARRMGTDRTTVIRGIRSLEQAGIILSHRSLGDATEIVLKEGVLPPRKSGYRPKDKPQPSGSSIDMDDVHAMVNDFGESSRHSSFDIEEVELLMNALHT